MSTPFSDRSALSVSAPIRSWDRSGACRGRRRRSGGGTCRSYRRGPPVAAVSCPWAVGTCLFHSTNGRLIVNALTLPPVSFGPACDDALAFDNGLGGPPCGGRRTASCHRSPPWCWSLVPSVSSVVVTIVFSLTESTVPRKPPSGLAGSPALSTPPGSFSRDPPPLDAPTTTASAVTVPPSAPRGRPSGW